MGRPLNLYPLLPEAAFGQVARSFTPSPCKFCDTIRLPAELFMFTRPSVDFCCIYKPR